MNRLRTIRQRAERPALWSAVCQHRFLGTEGVCHGAKPSKAGLTSRTPKTGFTLIEMLVAVTLVLLMMVMFGEIFQIASGSVTKQRTMADNDQNARTFISVIRADLDKRSFRTVVPFFQNEDPLNPGTPFGTRRGYFYISNNNNGFNGTPSDGSDEVLQFTVTSTAKLRNADETPYYGRAATLGSSATFYTNLNQPNWDDGQADPGNQAGASRAAEVCYFVRSGRLYRRVMLLREPLPTAGTLANPSQAAQPTNSAGSDYFASPYSFFWRDFDYSAHRLSQSLAAVVGVAANARFNGVDLLANDAPLTHILPSPPFAPNSFHPYVYSMGQTWNRFGFNHEIAGPGPLSLPGGSYSPSQNGLPREFGTNAATPPTNALRFFGRFTHEETSHAAFIYPQGASTVGNGNPMDGDTASTPGNTLIDANADGVIDQFAGGSRTGVDLLLSHVHEFRVEVWDERLNDFAPIGHTLGAGDFHFGRRLNAGFGPLGGPANVFDTWHPNFNRNFNLDAGGYPILSDDPPPYRALNYYPPTLPGPNASYWAPGTSYTTEDTNGNGFLDAGEDSNGNGVLDAARVFPYLDEDVNLNGLLDPGEDTNGNGTLDRGNAPFRAFGETFTYRCIRAGASGTALADEPNWPTTPTRSVRGNPADIDANADGDVTDPGDTDHNNNGINDLAEPDWICEYNVRPLRAIRITVRFEHPSARQMKQVTIVHSLRDTTAVP